MAATLPSDARLQWKTRVVAIVVILSNAFGNLSLAFGMKHRQLDSALSYVAAMFTPYVALGIVLLIVWLLTRMAFMSWADLTYIVPVTAFGYVASAILGRLFLNERITPLHWMGTLMIVLGVVLVGITNPGTTAPREQEDLLAIGEKT